MAAVGNNVVFGGAMYFFFCSPFHARTLREHPERGAAVSGTEARVIPAAQIPVHARIRLNFGISKS